MMDQRDIGHTVTAEDVTVLTCIQCCKWKSPLEEPPVIKIDTGEVEHAHLLAPAGGRRVVTAVAVPVSSGANLASHGCGMRYVPGTIPGKLPEYRQEIEQNEDCCTCSPAHVRM